MRMALLVGIDYYKHFNPLHGCVNDVNKVKSVLERHGDGSINFDCKIFTCSAEEDQSPVARKPLKESIEELFKAQAEISLFYFAGHGHIESTGGYLLTPDAEYADGGLPLLEILTMANKSPASNKIIILDSCHSGIAGNLPSSEGLAGLSEGLTILTASSADQYASEENGGGVFTSLLVDALQGGAANLTGDITPGSVYAHIDQSLGAWEQRPIFKTNVRKFVSLRRTTPPIQLNELRKIAELFPAQDYEFKLDPSFEPEIKGRDDGMLPPDQKNTAIFAILQKFNRLNLVVPVGAPHMWHAAMENKSCKLTTLGEHYRRLAKNNRL